MLQLPDAGLFLLLVRHLAERPQLMLQIVTFSVDIVNELLLDNILFFLEIPCIVDAIKLCFQKGFFLFGSPAPTGHKKQHSPSMMR